MEELIKILNNIKELFSVLFKLISTVFDKVKDFFIELIDTIFNGERFRLWTSLLLIFILAIFYFIIYHINPFNIFKTKNAQISFVLIISCLVSIFYFFAHRKNTDHYNTIRNLKSNEHVTNDRKYKFESTNFKESIKDPIFNLLKGLGTVLLTVLVPVIVISLIFSAYNNHHSMFNWTKIILGILILISTLAIIAKLFGLDNEEKADDKCNNLDDTIRHIFCIIKTFIFFIPCLLNVLVDKIHKDIKLTPKSIYLLFIIELILICLVFILPALFKYISTLNKNNLLGGEGPYYLNKEKTIGNYQQLYGQNKSLSKNDPTIYNLFDKSDDQEFNLETIFNGKNMTLKNDYNYTYNVSFYLYLNPQPNNTSIAYNKETELFNYANKPIILYNGPTRELIIKSKTQRCEGDQCDLIYKTKDIKYQKWLFFAINYDNGVIDVFIDGKLVGSKKNVPNFTDGDKITIGEDNGVHGSIKEISYYDKPRPQSDVEFLYDLTKN